MQYLPIFLNLHSKPCLLVGGGDIAFRKATLLARAGACIHLVALEIQPRVQALVESTGGDCQLRSFSPEDLENKALVIAATNDRSVNEMISASAQVMNIPVNVVDDPELCSFIIGSIVDRSPLMISVSSSGSSPVLARWIRSKLEAMIPSAFGKLASFLGESRDKVKKAIPDENDRRHFWETIINGPIAEKILAGNQEEASGLLETLLSIPQGKQGQVSLLGAGPGDPDLLTFKALRLLQQADVVLYDRLVNPAIVDMARRDAEKIYVGKARSRHTMPQDSINALLIKHASEGKHVARLKGGDPFIFGRGGEEIAGLLERNIPFQVVPGITAASGCACYAGIPLTHRDYAQSVRFVTGHLKDESLDLNWSELVHADQTVVFYMGLTGIRQICQKLIDCGRPKSTPVALVSKGTLPDQKVVIGTLENIADTVENEDIHAPTLIIVGEVVRLHHDLQWFEPNPNIEIGES